MNTNRNIPGDRSNRRHDLRAPKAICAVLSLLAFATLVSAAPPLWWSSRNAITSNPTQNDAVVNQGQLKHFTQKAVEELNARIPGGAGQNLNAILQDWKNAYIAQNYDINHPDPKDFQAITAGQLKWIAQKIHSRLVEIRYQDQPPSWLNSNPTTDSQLINIGQLKTAFAFDLTAPEDQIPDWWQKFYYNQTNLDPQARSHDPNTPDQNQTSDNSGAPTFLELYQEGNDPLALYTIRTGGGIQSRTMAAETWGLRMPDPHFNYSFAAADYITKGGSPKGGYLLIDPLPNFPPLARTWPYKIIPTAAIQSLIKDTYADFYRSVMEFNLSEARWGDSCYQYEVMTEWTHSQPVRGRYSFGITRTDYRVNLGLTAPAGGYRKTLIITKGYYSYSLGKYVDLPNQQPPFAALNLVVNAGQTEGEAVSGPAEDPGNNHRYNYTPVQVSELYPKIKNEDGIDIPGSEKPSLFPLTPLVEIDSYTNRIAHREMLVRIGEAFAGKKVTWSYTGVPGADPPNIRGQMSAAHPDKFEAATAYNAYGFRKVSPQQWETTVGDTGATAIRVNVPPVGFNKIKVIIRIEGIDTDIDLIDMEVPAVVVIDPGHGGTGRITDPDGGYSDGEHAVGPVSHIQEKTMALSYGIGLKNNLKNVAKRQNLNLKVFMTRTTDQNQGPWFRTNKARDTGADVFLSIHLNGSDDHNVRGVETWIRRSSQNVNHDEDLIYATRINNATFEAIRSFDPMTNNRGIKDGGLAMTSDDQNHLGNTANYHPIRSALVEIEFLDNIIIDNLLNGTNANSIQTQIVKNLSDAILIDLQEQPSN